MAYVSPRAEDIVLSREAMESLGVVSGLDDSGTASVRHISSTQAAGGGTGKLAPSSGGGNYGGGQQYKQ